MKTGNSSNPIDRTKGSRQSAVSCLVTGPGQRLPRPRTNSCYASLPELPWESDDLLRQRSLTAARQGNYATAIAGLTLLIERNGGGAVDYNNRGLAYFKSGALELALADYNRALQLNPRLASIYNNRANYYAAQGLLEQAIADYETALDLNPTNLRARINQGITYREYGQYEQAIDTLELALSFCQAFCNSDAEAAFLQCHVYAERGRTHHLRGDWNFAMADYQRALTYLVGLNLPSSPDCSHFQRQVESWLNELYLILHV